MDTYVFSPYAAPHGEGKHGCHLRPLDGRPSCNQRDVTARCPIHARAANRREEGSNSPISNQLLNNFYRNPTRPAVATQNINSNGCLRQLRHMRGAKSQRRHDLYVYVFSTNGAIKPSARLFRPGRARSVRAFPGSDAATGDEDAHERPSRTAVFDAPRV